MGSSAGTPSTGRLERLPTRSKCAASAVVTTPTSPPTWSRSKRLVVGEIPQLARCPTKGGVAMAVEVWEWVVMRDGRRNPVGVSMTLDRAKTALSRALVASGRPGRGSVRPVTLVGGLHSDTHYARMPVTDVAVYEQGTVRWERPSLGGRTRRSSCVVKGSRETSCGVSR
jgi:hypothetical protein